MGTHFGTVEKIRQVRSLGQSLVARCWSLVFIEAAPQCYGTCPPSEACFESSPGVCTCEIPTLSEWGIMGMALVMLGGVLYQRRRQTA